MIEMPHDFIGALIALAISSRPTADTHRLIRCLSVYRYRDFPDAPKDIRQQNQRHLDRSVMTAPINPTFEVASVLGIDFDGRQ
jgi:hypothetical protein